MTCGLLEKFFPDLKSSRLILAKDDPDLDVYKTNAGPWASRIIMGVKGAERQIAFIDQIAPKGAKVMIFDDNILKFMDCGKAIEAGAQLDELIAMGFNEMERAGAKIWYGAAFGMVAMHEDSRYSLFGQVMDDIERSCRFYEHDGATVRACTWDVSQEERWYLSQSFCRRLQGREFGGQKCPSAEISTAVEGERSRLDDQLKRAHGEWEVERQRLSKKCEELHAKAQSFQDDSRRKEDRLIFGLKMVALGYFLQEELRSLKVGQCWSLE
ncbi:unnamed protein product [Durusdinium trenchii]|uniref:Uncharacterized protein n=1 Tax=Durusdinium trenchii TaxID=1381693 RepID=A0ABP0T1R9_9DINO